MRPVKNMAFKSGIAGFMALNSVTLKKETLLGGRARHSIKKKWTLFGRRWGSGWFECVLGKPPLTHIRTNLEEGGGA